MIVYCFCRRTEAYIKKLEEAKPESVSMKIALNIGKMPTLGINNSKIRILHSGLHVRNRIDHRPCELALDRSRFWNLLLCHWKKKASYQI